MSVNNNMLDDLIQDICPAGNIQHSLRPRKRSYRNKIPSTYPNLDAFMIDSVEESTQLEDKFSDETPKLNFNLEDVIFESGATEEQKSDTAITHDDFNSSIEASTQCTLEEQCINLVPETPAASINDNDLFWSDYELRKEEVEKMNDDPFLIKNTVVKSHLTVFVAPANGGKTTLVKHFCEDLSRQKLNVVYVNMDGNPGDLKLQHIHAKEFGYIVLAPETRQGKSNADILGKLKDLADSKRDLSKNVYVIDTLKKIVAMNSKPKLKNALSIFRKLTLKGATVVLLAHANKGLDADGNPLYEGSVDLKTDVDELIYLISTKDEVNMTQDITTKPDKVRATFMPVSYRIYLNEGRRVCLLDEVLTPISDSENELIQLIKDAILNGKDNQASIINDVKGHIKLGHNKIREFLIRKSQCEDPLWLAIPTCKNNALRYSLDFPVVLPI
jgi:hypothetical protein